jgi:hypothetical protein
LNGNKHLNESCAVAGFDYRKSMAELRERQSVFQSTLHLREQLWRQAAQPFDDALLVDGFDLLGDYLRLECETGSAFRIFA